MPNIIQFKDLKDDDTLLSNGQVFYKKRNSVYNR